MISRRRQYQLCLYIQADATVRWTLILPVFSLQANSQRNPESDTGADSYFGLLQILPFPAVSEEQSDVGHAAVWSSPTTQPCAQGLKKLFLAILLLYILSRAHSIETLVPLQVHLLQLPSSYPKLPPTFPSSQAAPLQLPNMAPILRAEMLQYLESHIRKFWYESKQVRKILAAAEAANEHVEPCNHRADLSGGERCPCHQWDTYLSTGWTPEQITDYRVDQAYI